MCVLKVHTLDCLRQTEYDNEQLMTGAWHTALCRCSVVHMQAVAVREHINITLINIIQLTYSNPLIGHHKVLPGWVPSVVPCNQSAMISTCKLAP